MKMGITTRGKIEDWYMKKSGKLYTDFTLEDSMIVNVISEWEGKRKEVLEIEGDTEITSNELDKSENREAITQTNIIITDEQLNQLNKLNELVYTSCYMNEESEWSEIDYELNMMESRLHHLTNEVLMCKSFIITPDELTTIKRLRKFAMDNIPAEYRDKLYLILGKL